MFERPVEPDAFFYNDVVVACGQEAWCAAWQLAIDDLEANPPLLPTFSRSSIQAWLESR